MLVSPIKIQGKKTKIVPDILKCIPAQNDFLWIEPFLGSGEVLFNVEPKYALVCDNNKHIINFFNALQSKEINPEDIQVFLESHGKLLEEQGKEYYYKIRNDFNKTNNTLEFIFLNRSCFNGIMRFNNKGEFNVPFCNKNNRFSKSLITKIVNQVTKIQQIILKHGNDWKFICCNWEDIEKYNNFDCDDIIYYYDPPYIERHSTYFDAWTNEKNDILFRKISKLNYNFILSNWLSNKFRTNEYIVKYFNNENFIIKKIEHFYHVGGKESNRHSIIECIITKKEY